MLTRSFSLVALILLIVLSALALPNWINSVKVGDTHPSNVIMSGVVVILILAGAVMLLLFGVLRVNAKPAKEKA